MNPDIPMRGWTPAEVARMLRIGKDRVRSMIHSGELPAINTAPVRCGRPRYVVLPDGLAAFMKTHTAVDAKPSPRRRRRQSGTIDYFPD
jgi:excisionase family DNA binding protein